MLGDVRFEVEFHGLRQVWQMGEIGEELCEVRGGWVPETGHNLHQDLGWANKGKEFDQGTV